KPRNRVRSRRRIVRSLKRCAADDAVLAVLLVEQVFQLDEDPRASLLIGHLRIEQEISVLFGKLVREVSLERTCAGVCAIDAKRNTIRHWQPQLDRPAPRRSAWNVFAVVRAAG